MSDRSALIRRARLLAGASVAYNVIEAVIAIAAGLVAGSVALVGFGLDSTIEVSSGLIVLWRYAPILRRYEAVRHLDAKTMFESALGRINRAVRRLTVAIHAPSLQRMLMLVAAVMVLFAIEAIGAGGVFTGPREGVEASPAAILAWALLIAATGAVLHAQHQRFRVLIYISVIGLVISLAFVHLSAPDLALTQISVEVVTILLLLLALNLLPKTPPALSSVTRRVRDGALAVMGGTAMGAIAWAMLTRNPNDPISQYHLANSYSGGGGTNVVNVILSSDVRDGHSHPASAHADGGDLHLPARPQPARRRLHRGAGGGDRIHAAVSRFRIRLDDPATPHFRTHADRLRRPDRDGDGIGLAAVRRELPCERLRLFHASAGR